MGAVPDGAGGFQIGGPQQRARRAPRIAHGLRHRVAHPHLPLEENLPSAEMCKHMWVFVFLQISEDYDKGSLHISKAFNVLDPVLVLFGSNF
jgi:hypothetical protein